MSLDTILDRLSEHEEIDGLMVIGSAARDEVTPSSDYDLVILLSRIPVTLGIDHTYIANRMTDLNFMTVDDMDQLLESEDPIDPYTPHGRAFLRMGDGNITLDRSGRLGRSREIVNGRTKVRLLTER
jgi:predicted nucleotidyltransferase